MTFQIHAISPEPYADLFNLTEDELAARNIVRVKADAFPGFPCRVSLEDAKVGDELLLLNHTHLDAQSPYRAAHAIYIRDGAEEAKPAPGEIPDVLSRRLLSLRAFDGTDLMRDADVVEGGDLAGRLEGLFEDPAIQYIQIHNAKQGCFAAHATRASA